MIYKLLISTLTYGRLALLNKNLKETDLKETPLKESSKNKCLLFYFIQDMHSNDVESLRRLLGSGGYNNIRSSHGYIWTGKIFYFLQFLPTSGNAWGRQQ